MTLDAQLAIAAASAEQCLAGVRDASTVGDGWLSLLGYADWATEAELIREKISNGE